MKQFKLHQKVISIILTIFFIFISLNDVNDHAFTTGIINIHGGQSCLSYTPIHIDYYCSDYNCDWNN